MMEARGIGPPVPEDLFKIFTWPSEPKWMQHKGLVMQAIFDEKGLWMIQKLSPTIPPQV